MRTITISGPPGSGTTTVAKLLETQLSARYVNTGQIFRSMAQEYGMELAEFGTYVAAHPEIDTELDRRQVALAAQGGIILEGRLAGHVTHKQGVSALRVFLWASAEIRARRVSGRDGQDLEEARQAMEARAALERARYLDNYGIDIEDQSVYDLVIDSGTATPQEIAERVINGL